MADDLNHYPATGEEWVTLRSNMGALHFMYYEEAIKAAEHEGTAEPFPFSFVTWDDNVVRRMMGMGVYLAAARARDSG